MDLFLLALVILAGLAVSDLVVGVSNDAVNFLNSPVGSRAASRRTIMIIAGLGILAGVTFSSGMMEVARKGIFHPQYFTMPELMTIFLAVMLTDIVLLDLYNTFGLPTSTTVSIVFELLGAAVAVSLLQLYRAGEGLGAAIDYINTGKALTIIFGILLSIVVAFAVGAAVQFFSRLIFTFDYAKRLRRYGALWGGVALASIMYFVLIRGSKGASFVTPEMLEWIRTNSGQILLTSFLISAVIFQILLLASRVNILKIIVLAGTFALAMAFAANDLVNFIGAPLAGLHAYTVAQASGDLLGSPMEALAQPIRSNTFFLLGAGVIMVITLWMSRKARSVTRTEVQLGRQQEGYERFESTALSRTIVRLVSSVLELTAKSVPRPTLAWIDRRLDRSHQRPTPASDGSLPSFDLIRASVNLMVASALISLATSFQLPLSTTYVTFMVAMGTSMSDQAWGRDSAVYRVSGVLTVIGGWFFTAMVAVGVSLVFATLIFLAGAPAVIGILALAVLLIARTRRVHQKREEKEEALEVFNLRKIKDASAALDVTFEHTGIFLREVCRVLDDGFDGLFTHDRQRLRAARAGGRTIQDWSNVIAANIFKILRLRQWEEEDSSQRYEQTMSALQEISDSVRDIVIRSYDHVGNHHSGLLEEQIAELDEVRSCLIALLDWTSQTLRHKTKPDPGFVTSRNKKLRSLINGFHQNQVRRIQDNASKTRLSILFYSLTRDCLKIAQQSSHLLSIFEEPEISPAPDPRYSDGGGSAIIV